MILAFIMFIGFLIFGLYFFNPLDTTRVLDSSADYAMTAVKNNVTSELKIYGVVLDLEENNGGTIKLPLDDFNGDDNKYLIGKGIRVEDPQTGNLDSNLDGSFLYIDYKNNKIFYVKVGEFTPQYNILGPFSQPSYNISSSDKRNLIRHESVKTLKNIYDNNYIDLKKRFNLPNRVNFDFFLDLPGVINDVNATRVVPQAIDVTSKSERVEVFLDDGSVLFGDLIVRAW